jgi:DNA-binding CsgD family transcriptional regulator
MPDPESQFLDALYLGVRHGTAFDNALDLLCAMFDVASATLIDFDAARPHVSAQATVGLFNAEAARRYERDFAALDPAPPAFMKRPPGTAIPTYRLLPEETRRPGIFFSEFFRPLGLEECLGGTLASTNGRFAMIGLQRAPDRAAFDDGDIAKLERLMPHLSRALQLRRAFFALDRRASTLDEACDRVAAGMIGFDEGGRALFANEAARRISARDHGLALDRSGRPHAADRAANQRLAELQRDVASGGAGGLVRVPRPNGEPAYVVIVAPLFRGDGLDGGRRRGTLFVIHDPLHRGPTVPQLVAELFGLPLGSATLLAALAAGEELKDYAERAGISMNTVRFHLKTAYARTGAKRQSELVRLITAALRDLADHREGRDGG